MAARESSGDGQDPRNEAGRPGEADRGNGAGQGDGAHGRAWTYGRPGASRLGGTSQQGSTDGPPEQNAGWAIFSYLLAGMIAYGLVGWLVSRVTHIALIFPLGALAGLVLAIAGIVFKYGRP
jgi:ATP synthase protein I